MPLRRWRAGRPWRKRLFIAVAVLGVLTVAAELIARYAIGLGDSPLSMPHPRIEYLYRPHQDAHPFGNRFRVNAYGMRGAGFPPHKAQPDELRVLVFGDSVINGGNLTDESELATTRVARLLAAGRHRPVTVGNVSAGSWGPGNWLAYAREYGFFDADALVLVISSHDSADVPSFAPLDPATHPMAKPASALWEALVRYLPRYLPAPFTGWLGDMPTGAAAETRPADAAQTAGALAALREFLQTARAQVADLCVLQYPSRAEAVTGQYEKGFDLIQSLAQELGIQTQALGPRFGAAERGGTSPYRDELHPNARGQSLLAEAIAACIP